MHIKTIIMPIIFLLIIFFAWSWINNIIMHTNNLEVYLNINKIELKNDVFISIKRGIFDEDYSYSLYKGEYISVLKSSKGVFFLAPKKGIKRHGGRFEGLTVGGFYIENSNPNIAYVWEWPMQNMARGIDSPSPQRMLNNVDGQPEWDELQKEEFLESAGNWFYNVPWVDMDFKFKL